MSPFRLGAHVRRAGRIGLPLLSTAAVLAVAVPANAAQVTRRFTDPGCSLVGWTVPDGVAQVSVVAQGATGERVGDHSGGTGVRVTATIPVTPGAQPQVCVDSGGGAPAGTGALAGGRGGGFAAIAFSGALATADVVAGGGGGAGASAEETGGGAGGGGGMPAGTGQTGQDMGMARGGLGATGTAGGAGGINIQEESGPGQSGTFTLGGASTLPALPGTPVGGAGGGGWYGGGAGASGSVNDPRAAGGGGGSSYCRVGVTCDGVYIGAASYVEVTYEIPESTTTELSATPNPVVRSEDVTLTATVTPIPDGGTVAFAYGNGEPVTGCETIAVGGEGVATCPTSAPGNAGDVGLTATYSGTSAFLTSDDELTLTVLPTPTNTFVSIDPATPVVGQLATISASVQPAPDAGTVDFTYVDGTPIPGCGDRALVAGIAECNFYPSVLLPDEQTVGAAYSGSQNFAESSGGIDFDPLAPIALVTPSPVGFGDVVIGQTMTRTITVDNAGDWQLLLGGFTFSTGPAPGPPGLRRDVAARREPPVNTTDFDVVETDCDGVTLAPGESCTATISFTPRALGASEASLVVSGSQSNQFDSTALTGTGVATPVDPPSGGGGEQPLARQDPPTAPVGAGTPVPPAPPVTPPALRGAIFSPRAPTTIPVTTGGDVSVTLACPAGAACDVDGTLTLAVTSGTRARAAATKTKVLLRFSGVRVAANATKTLKLRLPAKFVKQQQKLGVRKLRTTLTLKTTLGNGSAVMTRKQVTLVIPRARAAQRRAPAARPKPAQRPSFTG